MSALLTGETAVVTGGSSGNGRAIALTFAEHGADVVVADVVEEPREGGDPTAAVIEAETDANATFVDCDVTNVDDLDDALDAAEDYGGVSIMVNNAGIMSAEDLFATTEEDYEHLMDVNVKGVFFGSQLAAERMVDAGREGSIVNMSSVGGLFGSSRVFLYSTSKGAVKLMSYALAGVLGEHGIRVNALHPGTIKTAMTIEFEGGAVGTEDEDQIAAGIPLKRIGTPQDVANAALFLASDLAGYVTAESLVVDGGALNSS
jgi:NAD(P)-dependent dehydrogenase (short-subunit alcohol dehydrogenase family)